MKVVIDVDVVEGEKPEVQMKKSVLKNVEAVVVMSLLTVSAPVLADKFSDGEVACKDINEKKAMYGCAEAAPQVPNKKMACLEALKRFQVFRGQGGGSGGHFGMTKPGTIKKGDKMIITGGGSGGFAISDEKKNYQLPKEKIVQQLQESLGEEAKQKDSFDVQIMTPEGGTAKLKLYKDKNAEASENGQLAIGKWELQEMESSDSDFATSEEDALIVMGQENEVSNFPENVKSELEKQVTEFPSNVEKQISNVEAEFTQKAKTVDENQRLSSVDKVKTKRKLQARRDRKKDRLKRLQSKYDVLKRQAYEACGNNSDIIRRSVLNSHGGGKPGRNIANTGGITLK